MRWVDSYLNLRKRKIGLFLLIYMVTLILDYALVWGIDSFFSAFLVKYRINVVYFGVLAAIFDSLFWIMLYFLSEKKQLAWYQYLYYGGMCFFILLMLVAGYVSHGESIRTILLNDKHDVLMDFYNSVQYGMKPYAAKVIYPPLINVFYGFLGRFMVIQDGDIRALRTTQLGALVFGMYIIFVYNGLIYFFFRLKNGTAAERMLFIFTMLFSLPFLYNYDRANSVIIALLGLMIFVYFHHSEYKKKRIFSYISLAVAAGVKISPAIFGLLLLRERKYKEAAVAMVIGVVIFMGPFILTDGNIFILLENIQYTTTMFQNIVLNLDTFEMIDVGNGVFVNLLSTIAYMGRLFNFNGQSLAEAINLIILIFGLIIVLLARKLKQWKVIALLSILLVLCPGFSNIYNILFMSLPLVLFLNTCPAPSKLNVMYLLLFIGMFMPGINAKIGVLWIFADDWHPLTIMTIIESWSILLFTVLLLMEGVYCFYREYLYGRPIVHQLCGACFFVLLAGGIIFTKVFVDRPVEAFFPENMKVQNAGKGFIMEHGQYTFMKPTAQILLKSDKLLERGLTVNWSALSGAAGEEKYRMKIYADDFCVGDYDFDNSGGFIYIPQQTFRNIKREKTFFDIKVEITGNKMERQGFPFFYIGYAEPLEKLVYNEYITRSASGFVREKKRLRMKENVKILLESEKISNGIKIRGNVAACHLKDTVPSPIFMRVIVNEHLVKSIQISGQGRFEGFISPEKYPGELVQELKNRYGAEVQLCLNSIGFEMVTVDYVGSPSDLDILVRK